MKHTLIFLSIFFSLIYNNSLNAQKLQLRISLGNGKPYSTDRQINTTLPNAKITFDRSYESRTLKKLSERVFVYPQIGLMLDYIFDNSNVISFGIMGGRSELQAMVNRRPDITKIGSYNSDGGGLRMLGLEYSRKLSFLKSQKGFLKNRHLFYLYTGIFLVSHDHNNYDSGPIIFVTKDTNGNTIDSSTSKSIVLHKYGGVIPLGIRYSYFNKKQIEKFSFSIKYDYGLVKLWQSIYYNYYAYKTEHIITSMISKGSQLKISISFPINLYDFKKDKFKIFK